MNLRQVIDGVAATVEPEAQPRMKAALEIGARLALEAVLAKGGYTSDAKELLAEMNGKPAEQPEGAAV